MKKLVLKPWAKVNLYLELLGREENGYHQLCTLLQPIALFDELRLTRSEGGLLITSRGNGLPEGQTLPTQSDNLVFKAAQLFFCQINESPAVTIDLVKNIPIGGGLGGGSSDAAMVLTGLNQLWENRLADKELVSLASSLGMDVPFFLYPAAAICRGRGEIIAERLAGVKLWLILVNPGRGLSTASVYRKWDELEGQRLALTREAADYNILTFFRHNNNNIDNLIDNIKNDLERPALGLFPELKDILEILIEAGALRSFLCGSGSTVCGIAAAESEALEVAARVKKLGSSNWWIKVVTTI